MQKLGAVILTESDFTFNSAYILYILKNSLSSYLPSGATYVSAVVNGTNGYHCLTPDKRSNAFYIQGSYWNGNTWVKIDGNATFTVCLLYTL